MNKWATKPVGYNATHDWVGRQWGKAVKCEAAVCAKRSEWFEWANLSGKYKRERSDWKQLCRSCHRLLDKRKPVCLRGHLQTAMNTRFSNFKRYCKDCERLYYEAHKNRTAAKERLKP